MTGIKRRDLLTGSALLLLGDRWARSGVIAGHLPWHPDAGATPQPVQPGPWMFFTDPEGLAVEALADRFIPPDPHTPGGKDAGCAVFIDRQLAGPYGRREGWYTGGPFNKGVKQQGPQTSQAPAELYRAGLAALDRYCHTAEGGGKPFAQLDAARQDDILHRLESGELKLEGVEAATFFEQVLKDVQQGFFADPIYGGNRDMCSWKMIGFPGARYDYTEWVLRHNERYPYPPVGIAGRSAWNPGSR